MAILNILIHPNDFLRKRAKRADSPLDSEIQKLIQDMIETMRQKKGVGLAAPQVGRDLKIIVIETEKGDLPIINPEIIKRSWFKKEEIEGCLSLPGIYGLVKRSIKIKVRGLDKRGQKLEFKAQGLLARIIQHEVDHLDGILFIDRTKKITKEKPPDEIEL